MADHTENAIMHFGTSGEVEYASTLKEINAVLTTAGKVYRSHIAALGSDGTAIEKLTAQQQKLETQLAAAGKRSQMYSDELDKMREAGTMTGAEYTKLVGKLADSQRVEASLQGQLNKVNTEIKEQGSEASQAKSKLSELQSEGDTLDQKQKELASSAKLENAQLKANGTESEQLAAKQKQLKAALDLGKQSVSNLEQQLKATKTAYGENSNEATQMATKLNTAKTKVVDLENSLQDLGKSSGDAGDGLEDINKKLDMSNLMEAGDKLAEVGDKVMEVGGDLAGMANDYSDSQNKIQASMGGTEESAAKLNKVVQSVFEGGVVDSIDEANEAVVTVKSAFTDLNNTDLTKLTNQFVQISQKTGTDVQENVNAAQQLMKNFGVTGEQALDLIAQGYQNNLNKNGDFLDTLNEYPVQFKAAGYSASEMLSIIDSGMKSGTFNTDKAADAIKEMQIRMGDGTFAGNMQNFSKDTQNIFKEWQKGKATTADVAASIGADMEQMSPAKQQAAVSLLGSQFEDLGVKGSLSLLEIGNSYDKAGGKAEAFNKKTPGQEFESSIRKLKDAFVPLIQQLTPAVAAIANFVSGLAKMPEPVKVIIAGIAGFLAIMSQLMPIIGAVGAIITGGLLPALAPIAAIVGGVIAVIAGLVLTIKNWGAITTWLKGIWQNLVTFFNTAKTKLATVFNSFGPLLTTFKQFFSNTFSNIKLLITGLKTTISGVLNVIVGLFTGNGAKIKKGFQQVFQGLVDIGASMLRQLINSVTSGLTGIVNAFSGIFGKARGIVSSIWSAIRGFFSSNLSSILGTVRSIFGTLVGAITHPLQTAKSAIGGIISGIKSLFNFHISWPHIPLPHFSLSGAFNPLKGQIPHVAVDWYAQGGIMTQPTLMGFNNGRAQVGGEAGAEGVIPLNNDTWNKMGAAIAAHMPTGGPIVLQVDGRTFATITGPYTSDYLKQQDATQNFSYGRRN